MISKYINLIVVAALAGFLSACSSSSGSASAGTQVSINAAPSPAIAAAMPAGSKTFTNDLNDEVTLTKAYLVISSATIETGCGSSFSAAAEGVLNLLVPQVNAHTVTTPTSTGEPFVINLLGVDGGLSSIGSLSPPVGDYCGVDIDMLAADADANNLPVGTGEPDMIGKTLFIKGSYILDDGVTTGSVAVSTGVTLKNKELLLNALMIISSGSLNGTINIGVNYDRWFDTIDLVKLEAGDAVELNQMLLNVTDSIHQL